MKKWKVAKVEIPPGREGSGVVESLSGKSTTGEDNYKISRSNPLFIEVQEKDYYEVVSLSSGYYSTYKRGGEASQYESVNEVSLSFSTNNPDTSNHYLEKNKNSLNRSSDQMPDLSSNVINKELNGSDSCNWYLLKKFGDTNSNFSTYKPSIHRSSAMINGTRIEGVLDNYNQTSKDSVTTIICKFFCITTLVILFIFIIIIVSVVISSGRSIFGSM